MVHLRPFESSGESRFPCSCTPPLDDKKAKGGKKRKKMKIEDQEVSLELAKEMKELGVKQDGYFSYFQYDKWSVLLKETREIFAPNSVYNKDNLICSAFTVAELGEMLPNNDNENGEYVTIKTGGNEWLAWEIQKGLYDTEGHYIIAKTEADARAKMLIYLKQEGGI